MQRAYDLSMAAQNLASHIDAQPEAHDRLYKQIALRIAELIEHGTMRPGERIPSVRELSEQEEVSIATVTQAYRVLESRGLIEARPQSSARNSGRRPRSRASRGRRATRRV